MKNKLFRLSIPLLICLTGCGDNSSVFSVPEISEEPDIIVKNLLEAIENTKNYNIYFYNELEPDSKNYVELKGDSYYCYYYDQCGYAITDEDPDYAHFFSLMPNQESFKYEMTMNGRIARKNEFIANLEQTNTFYNILLENRKMFKKDTDTHYIATGYTLSNISYQFFRLSEFKYTNYFELNLDNKGRIKSFNAGEYSSADYSDLYITERVNFEYCDFEDIEFVKDWINNGKPTKIRVADYKATYTQSRTIKPCYENGEISATVTAIDYDGSFFIAEEDYFNGPAGIKVTPKESQYKPQIGDFVKVNGSLTVDKTGYYSAAPRFVDAEVTFIEKKASIPTYNEESMIDTYGEGFYASNMFTRSPFFTGSLYSGYGYAGDIPTTINRAGETTFNIYCPSWIYLDTNEPFVMKVHVPYEYGEDKINTLLNEIRSLGDYTKVETPQLVYFENVIITYSSLRGGSIDLHVVPTSYISHRLSFNEWLEKDFNITNFPTIPAGEGQTGMFHFGNASGYYLENQFTDSYMSFTPTTINDPVSGLHYFANSIDKNIIESFKNELVEFGGQLLDVYSLGLTTYSYHYIYKLPNNIYVDVYVQDYLVDGVNLYVFIYEADKEVRCSSIEEKIEASCGDFFKGEDFIRVENSYDKDYHIYRIPSYAGNHFTKENPLISVTVDMKGVNYENYRKAYLDEGFKVYREDGKTAYSYVTRGVSRVVYYKENANGKKTFLDFGSYPTSDYTFVHHDAFDNRIEMLIYEADTPIHTQYIDNLDEFVDGACEYMPNASFKWTLPSKYKCEYYKKDKVLGGDCIDYGYGFNSNVFIYPEHNTQAEVDELYNYIIDTLTQNGFTFSYNGKQSTTYSIVDETSFTQVSFCIMKNYERGFVRMLDSIGGVDF